MTNALALHAAELIAAGEDPQALAHAIHFPGWPEGDHLSTRLQPGADLTGLTSRYRSLAQWAADTSPNHD